MSNGLFIQVHDLVCLRYDKPVVGPLSFGLSVGEILHIVGPNGAGKTTLLQTLVGLWSAYRGQLRCESAVYLGTKRGLRQGLSVAENLQWLQCLHSNRLADDGRALLAEIGLQHKQHWPVEQLSSGQQQRLALLRLLIATRRLWVLDEPWLTLDEYALTWLNDKLRGHTATGGAVLLASHQPLTHFPHARYLKLEPTDQDVKR